MPEENYTRSDYLKSLLNQKKAIGNNDSPLLNPSVRNADDVSANTDSSRVSAGSTAIQNETGESEQYKESRNGWQRFWDTIGNFTHNINEGIQKYILDPIGDAGIWLIGGVGSLFGGNTEWAEKAIDYDWGAHFLNLVDQTNYSRALFTGDFFSKDYWENYADIGSVEESRKNFAELRESSFMSEVSPEVQQGFETGEQIVGALLPSILLAVFTGGASAKVQAAAFATQVGVAGASGFGRGVNESLKEGADYGKAGLYGLARGGTDAALTFAGMKIGGQLLNGGVGSKVGNAVFGKTGNVLLSTMTRIGVNAGVSGVTRAVDEALVRPAEKLIYDQEAWKKAYGDTSATYKTLSQAAKAGLTAAAMSTISQSITEGAKLAIQGKEKYVSNFVKQYDYSQNKKNFKSELKEIQKVSEEMTSVSEILKVYETRLTNHDISETEYNAAVKLLLNEFNKLQDQGNYIAKKLEALPIKESVEAKYGDEILSSRTKLITNITDTYNVSTQAEKALIHKQLTKFFDEGWKYDQVLDAVSNAKGSEYIKPNASGMPMLTYNVNNKEVSIPLQIGYKDQIKAIPSTANQFTNSIKLLGNGNIDTKYEVVIKPSQFIDKEVILPNKTNELIISQEVAKEISKNNTSEQIKEFFKVVKDNKGKQVIKDGDRYLIVNTYKDSNGVSQTAITTIDSKFKGVTSIKIQNTDKIIPSQVSSSRVVASKINDAVISQKVYNNEPSLIKAYGELNHERIISMKKSADIIDIARKQIFDKVATKKGDEYKVRIAKGKLTKEIFEAVNRLEDKYNEKGYMVKSDYSDAIEEIATQLAESQVIRTTQAGVVIESTAGHKEDLIKAITHLIEAKSELSKVAKLQKRFDITIEKKNQQIASIYKRANEKLEKVGAIFNTIKKDLQRQLSERKKIQDAAVQITRYREKFMDKVTGDYDYNSIEERDVHTIELLASPLASLTRNKGKYSINADSLAKWQKAKDIYIPENYDLKGSVEYDENVGLALREAIDSLSQDVGKTELSLDSYNALRNYQNEVRRYERELARIERQERKPSAYTASKELDNYDMNIAQKIFDPISKNFGGKAGEIFKMFGYGEITKKTVIALDQASGEKINFVAEKTLQMAECMPKGFHHRENAGKINGVKILKGELVYLYMATELAPVNAENINVGGFGLRGNKHIDWVYEGSDHLDEIKNKVASLITDSEKEIANSLFKFINGPLQKDFVAWQKNVKHQIDVPIVKDYLMLYKQNNFLTSIDKMVKGEPAFRYAEKRTNDKRGVIIPDIVEVLTSYIDGLGTQMYLTPAVHNAWGLLNSKDQNGVIIHQKIAQKYGDKGVKYLTDLVDAWIKKGNSQTQNIISKTMNFLTEGFTVAKLADFVRPIKNYFSFITSYTGLGKQAKSYTSRFSKEVRDDVSWLIENHIYNLKYREYDNALLKGNAPTTYSGIKGKVDKVLMTPVIKVDKAAMVMGLTAIVNDVKASHTSIRDNKEVIQFIKDAYSIFNLCNVNGDPNHQNILNEHTLTKYMFNILAGAKRAQVASNAIQMSLWQQNHKYSEDDYADMVEKLDSAKLAVGKAQEKIASLEDEYEKGLESLILKRDFRDYVVDSKQDQALIAEARKEVKEQVEQNKAIRDELEGAREEEARARSEEKTYQNEKESYEHYKYSGGQSIPLQILLKSILAGVLVSGVGMLMNYLYGKKNFDEYTKKEILVQVATNSFLNWIPALDSIGNKILKGYDIEPPMISTLNNFIGVFENVYNSVSSAQFNKGIINGLITALEGITGFPLETIKKYIYGIMKIADPEKAIEFNSLFYNTTPNYASRLYNEYVEKGNDKMAKAYLSYMSSSFKGGVTDDIVNNELLDLSKQGYNAIPKNILTEYTNEAGDSVKLSSAQITQFTEAYGESLEVVKSLIKTSEYKTSTSEEKSKYIKSIYDYYYEYAKAKALNVSPNSKIAKMLLLTGGKIDLAQYMLYLQKMATITENKQKTRKELVLDYVNRLKGLKRQEKILLMYLGGYSVEGTSKNVLVSYLIQKGATRKEALNFIEGNKNES